MSPAWLKALPWSTIISNAPMIVDGAKKLASLVKSKAVPDEIPPASANIIDNPQAELTALRARVQRLEEEQRQIAELMRTLAESQAQITEVVDALRTRARLGVGLAVILLISVVILVLWTLTR